jgi:hypothetical protein
MANSKSVAQMTNAQASIALAISKTLNKVVFPVASWTAEALLEVK